MPNSQACAIKILLLLYSVARKAYISFIPNDPTGFIGCIRKFIQQNMIINKGQQPSGDTSQSNHVDQTCFFGTPGTLSQTSRTSVGEAQLSAPPLQQQMLKVGSQFEFFSCD